jgi:hypothetical protein
MASLDHPISHREDGRRNGEVECLGDLGTAERRPPSCEALPISVAVGRFPSRNGYPRRTARAFVPADERQSLVTEAYLARNREFESSSLQERVERTAIACSQPIARPKVADAEDRVGRWIDERIDPAHIYAEIWKDAAPAHLVDVAAFCDSDDTHTGTAVELAGKPEYLCPALIQRPNDSAVQPFRLIGTRAGSRPKIPKLVFDTTFLSWRPADARLFG